MQIAHGKQSNKSPDTQAVTSKQAARREPAIDICRALAVVGVVATHTVEGMANSNILDEDHPAYEWILNLGMLRLPTLALLMGLFVYPGIKKRGARVYLHGRLVTLGYLYIVWCLIQGSIVVLTNSVRNGAESSWANVLTLWTPEGQMWFLAYMVLATAIFTYWQPWNNKIRTTLIIALCLIVTLIMWGRNYNYVGVVGLSLLFFSAAGVALGLHRATDLFGLPTKLWTICGALSTITFVLLLKYPHNAPAKGIEGVSFEVLAISFTTTLAGIVVLASIAKLLSLIPILNRVLQFVGQHTLEIFVMHMIIYSGTRIILQQGGVGSPSIHLIAGIIAGVVIPLIVAKAAPSIKLGWMFQPPQYILSPIRARRSR